MFATGPGPVDVVLRDGSTLRVRVVRPQDAPGLRAMLGGLSDESRWLRFFSSGIDLDDAATWAAGVGGERGLGLVATAGERIVAHAVYVRTGAEQAEVAFEVVDDLQGLGIGTILLAHLASAAERDGIATFAATVHPSNRKMVAVFRDSGFAVEVHPRPGELEIIMPASVDPAAHKRFEDRDRTAAVASVKHVLQPGSVALIGASRRPGSVGAAVLENLRSFRGPLYIVHPIADEVGGLRTVRSLPAPVDLAVIAVPAAAVSTVARECGEAGVRALVVLSAGFIESGERGRARQAELLEICREFGMRLVGPNSLGVLNTASGVNATFAPYATPAGRLAYASQSAAVGITAIAEAGRRGLGLSSFVSTGDKADLSGNDLLRYWEQDAATDVILLYLESFGNPRRFGQIARQIGRAKPIVAIKGGRSAAGARAALSRTGALLAASDVTIDALFAHAGVIRTDTLGEQLDVAALLAAQPLPRGDRIAIVTNAGGPGIACADACSGEGLRVEPLSARAQDRLRPQLVPEASTANPVDMIATATAEDFQRTIELLASEPEVDAVVAIFIPPLVTRAADVAAAIHAVAPAKHTPVLAVFMGLDDAERAALRGDGEVPVYGTPEEAARALGRAVRYAAWRRQEPDPLPPLGQDSDTVDATIAGVLARGEDWLAPEEVDTVLAAYGVPRPETRIAATPAAAGRQAAALGGALAIKAIAPGLAHKSDAGGVALDVRGAAAATRAARRVASSVRAAGHEVDGFFVQQMAPAATKLIVGIIGDRDFGPVVACGAGGRAVELLGDVAVRLAPVGPREAGEMLRSLRTFPLLTGHRGAPLADLEAVEQVVMRIAALGAAHPEIAELDCNPVLAGPDGAVVVDARIRVSAPPPARPFPALDR